MRARGLVVVAVLSVVARALGGEAAAPPKPAMPSIDLRLVPEMEPLPEVEAWPECPPTAFAEDVKRAAADWQKKLPEVQKRLTPEAVRSLSRWAVAEMRKYDKLPPLRDVAWKPVRTNEAARQLLLEGTLDTLPSHSPLVTRWLKGYLVYSTETKSIRRIFLTIRGELQE